MVSIFGMLFKRFNLRCVYLSIMAGTGFALLWVPMPYAELSHATQQVQMI
ncbi:MAG: hypothetical protein ACI8SK_001195 [Shewanella sp.]|jgi:hypothetical protein